MIRIAAPLALMLVAVSAPAFAQQSVAVNFADLNLGSAQGAQTLARRVNRAVHNVCEIKVASDSILRRFDHACLVSAAAGAERQVAAVKSKAEFAQILRNRGTLLSAR